VAHLSWKRLSVNQKTWIFAQLMENSATEYLPVKGNPLNVKRFFRDSSGGVHVKICGIKNEAEATAAIAAGAGWRRQRGFVQGQPAGQGRRSRPFGRRHRMQDDLAGVIAL